MRWMYILLMLIVVSGCSTWPEQGKGGWAEEYHLTMRQIAKPGMHQHRCTLQTSMNIFK
jgi:hypothetical protein